MNRGEHVVEWGWAGAALAGEPESGDAHVVVHLPGAALVAVIDGLGHGIEAAAAAQQAARTIEARALQPLDRIVEECHEALRRSRGAVMSLATFDARASVLSWLAVGNVEAVLLRRDPLQERRETITPRGGIVGYQIPSLRPATIPISPGDTLVMATDGIRGSFIENLTAAEGPARLARSILAAHARGSDDSLVLAARFVGLSP